MILCDTNILSTFARVDALDLLFKLFPNDEFAIPQSVHHEIIQAVQLDFTLLRAL